jgi:hypothetical protein
MSRIASRVLNLGTRWRWVVSCTPQPHVPIAHKNGWAREAVWTLRRDLLKIEAQFLGRSACNLVPEFCLLRVLDVLSKRSVPYPAKNRTLFAQPIASRFINWAIQAPVLMNECQSSACSFCVWVLTPAVKQNVFMFYVMQVDTAGLCCIWQFLLFSIEKYSCTTLAVHPYIAGDITSTACKWSRETEFTTSVPCC